MKITTLVENTRTSRDYGCIHGLSFYIETKKHKILFDVGPTLLFLKNAEKLSIDIGQVDTVIISHGHSDHGGALRHFLRANKIARVYVQERAFEKHYVRVLGMLFNVGLDPKLAEDPRISQIGGSLRIDDELTIFPDVTGTECHSPRNDSLYVKRDGRPILDDFSHEQNLLITEDGKTLLMAGCAHRGIVNIAKRAQERLGKAPDWAIAGFHLFSPDSGKTESEVLVTEIGKRLAASGTAYYTCHCTGLRAYGVLKNVMNDKIGYLAAGSTLEL